VCGVATAILIAARLPFLLIANRFFDSDEAVQGLMALHVLKGEFPAFYWGQHYKGVPDIYPLAAIFAVFGPSVTALKASTLGWFAAFGCVQFALVARLHSRRVAWLSVLLLAAAPPVLVQWSLSGNAEFAIVMLSGAVLLLAWDRWRHTGSERALAIAAFAFGFGLWVQQFILYYAIALAATELLATDRPAATIRQLFAPNEAGRPARVVIRVLLGIAALYLVLGFVAFFGGVAVYVGDVFISITHAQKLWRVTAALIVLSAIVGWFAGGTWRYGKVGRAAAVAFGCFLAGYAPALVHRLSTGRGGPMAGMNWDGFRDAVHPIATVLVPIIFGYRTGSTERLNVPWWTALVPIAALLAAFMLRRASAHAPVDRLTFFRVFAVTTPLVFLASGSYVDVQSYRYLLPLYAALPVLFAEGIEQVWRRHAVAGAAFAAVLAGLFVWQQADWYRRLSPDRRAESQLTCMAEQGIRFAHADYWDAYKLTFLARERAIVAQSPRPDRPTRYPPYDAAVAAHDGVDLAARCP
jgi:hypothetical protein